MKKLHTETNLFLAAYLLTRDDLMFEGHESKSTMRSGSPKSILSFKFSPEDKAKSAISDFYAGALVPANTLFANLRNLKQIIVREQEIETYKK